MYFHLSQEDKDEIFDDRCDAFRMNLISEQYFRQELARLGYNATEIEEVVKHCRPPPGEEDGEFVS